MLLQSDLVSVHFLDENSYVVLAYLPSLCLMINQSCLCVHHLVVRVQQLQHLQNFSVYHQVLSSVLID